MHSGVAWTAARREALTDRPARAIYGVAYTGTQGEKSYVMRRFTAGHGRFHKPHMQAPDMQMTTVANTTIIINISINQYHVSIP